MRYLLALIAVVALLATAAGGDLHAATWPSHGTGVAHPGYTGARLAPSGSSAGIPWGGAVLPQLPEVAGPRSATISRGPATRRVVHLSFDAGADRGYAESILNTLAEQGVPASFGMTGRWAQAHPDLIQRMAAEGHQLINHTWDHRSFTGLSDRRGRQNLAEIHQQLERTEALLVEMTGQSTKPFFRPPYGDYDNTALEATYSAGYAYNTMWTVDSFGWRRIPAADIVARCLRLAEPGAIILMHVGIESLDGPALPTLIGRLREQGYGMVSIADLFAP
jgi:peptidoglycan-N-acetylglucosamine deacetylase